MTSFLSLFQALPPIISIILLIILFVILGFSANQVINNVRSLASKLGVPVFLLGLILGVLTSFPEVVVSINALFNGLPSLITGNLFGGIIVMLSLVLGISIILNRGINNDGNYTFLFLALGYILLPLLLALKGSLNVIDGLVLVILYFLLIWRLYRTNQGGLNLRISFLRGNKILRELLMIIFGIIIIVISANFIVKITSDLLIEYNLSAYLVGLLFFPLGTNLPELTVAIASWRRKAGELSFSTLLGSSLTNILIIGVLAMTRSFSIVRDYSHFVTLIFLVVLSVFLIIFYRSGKRLSRLEGAGLLLIYILFVIFQLKSF